jgi:hypothetical protein
MLHVKLGQHMLDDGTMPFGLSILKVCLGTDGGGTDVMALQKSHKVITIEFGTSINEEFTRDSRP